MQLEYYRQAEDYYATLSEKQWRRPRRERLNCLLQRRVSDQQRLAAETPEERRARLLVSQQQRTVAETPETPEESEAMHHNVMETITWSHHVLISTSNLSLARVPLLY